MNVSIVGSGYVGQTVAAYLANRGHEVFNVDIEEMVVDNINNGVAPIDEPGLDKVVEKHGGKRLCATTDYGALIRG